MMKEVSQQSRVKEHKQQTIMNRLREWHETKTVTTTYPQKIIENTSNVSERQAAYNLKLQKVLNDLDSYNHTLEKKL